MDRVTPEKFNELLAYSHPRSISLYLSTEAVGPIQFKRKAQFKNLMDEALAKLANLPLTDDDLEPMVKAIDRIITNPDFWKPGNKTVALFLSPEKNEYFHLPVDVKPVAVVSNRFHLKPLIPLITACCDFYLLSLSKKEIKVFKGDRYGIKKVNVPDLPESFEEVVGTETGERHLQFHTGTSSEGSGKRPASYHGNSSWKDDKQRYEERYLHAVEKALQHYLQNKVEPLVLAGVEREVTLYKDMNHYHHLLDDYVAGNTKELTLKQLHQRAFPIVERYFKAMENEAVEQFLEEPKDSKVSTDIVEILQAAALGRVETVLVARGVRKWGTFDPTTLQVRFKQTNEGAAHDLMDLACAQTLLTGGQAYVLPPDEVPSSSAIAAKFRY